MRDRQSDRTDPLTGLPRMATALIDLPRLIQSNQPDRLIGIISLAVVPDSRFFRMSADAVHRLRVELSRAIPGLLRPADLHYVASQREWLIILPNLISSAALTLAMIRLRDELAKLARSSKMIDHLPKLVQGSSQWPENGNDPLHLLQSARIARLVAEQKGLGSQAYHPDLETETDNEQELLDELRRAIQDSLGLSLYLQPQIEIETRRCLGAEALLRWQRSNGTWIAPSRILDLIDRLGLRLEFNRWLLLQAAQIQLQLASAGISIVLSINLSANDLLDTELPDMIGQTLSTWDIPPEKIMLEITETMMVGEGWQVMDVLERMRNLGLRLSIDDFGTGYAGMSYLQRLPVNEVKIDQMFVRQINESEKAREIVTSIIQLAGRLKMSVIAEGIETPETLDTLAKLGCRFAQGYLFSKPVPLVDFIAWWDNKPHGLFSGQVGVDEARPTAPDTVEQLRALPSQAN